MKISNNASSGGTTFGGTHESGNDIKMTVIGGDNVRLEGGEGVLSRLTMKDNKKYNFNGKLSTPCEIASELNVKNGGRKFDCSNELQQKVDEFGDGGNIEDKRDVLIKRIKNIYKNKYGINNIKITKTKHGVNVSMFTQQDYSDLTNKKTKAFNLIYVDIDNLNDDISENDLKQSAEVKYRISTPKHAKEYDITAKKPLYVERLWVNESCRNKGIGAELLKEIEQYAKDNNCDVIFGYITQKADFTRKTDNVCYFNNIECIKWWLQKQGYAVNGENNDFHKVIGFAKGGLVHKTKIGDNKYIKLIKQKFRNKGIIKWDTKFKYGKYVEDFRQFIEDVLNNETNYIPSDTNIKDIPITKNNYHISTEAEFEIICKGNCNDEWQKLKNKIGKKEFSSASGSNYLIDENNVVYRYSDHWGSVASCFWGLKGYDITSKNKTFCIAKCNLKDFKRRKQYYEYGYLNDIEAVKKDNKDKIEAMQFIIDNYDLDWDIEDILKDSIDFRKEYYNNNPMLYANVMSDGYYGHKLVNFKYKQGGNIVTKTKIGDTPTDLHDLPKHYNKEIFDLQGHKFDIAKAYSLINKGEIKPKLIQANPKDLNSKITYIDTDKAKSIKNEYNKPIGLIIRINGTKDKHLLIDGNHRTYKAVLDNKDSVYYWYISNADDVKKFYSTNNKLNWYKEGGTMTKADIYIKDLQKANDKAKEIKDFIKNNLGFIPNISVSVTDFGTSLYIQNWETDAKIRISDHSVTNTHRVLNEIHYSLWDNGWENKSFLNDVDRVVNPEKYAPKINEDVKSQIDKARQKISDIENKLKEVVKNSGYKLIVHDRIYHSTFKNKDIKDVSVAEDTTIKNNETQILGLYTFVHRSSNEPQDMNNYISEKALTNLENKELVFNYQELPFFKELFKLNNEKKQLQNKIKTLNTDLYYKQGGNTPETQSNNEMEEEKALINLIKDWIKIYNETKNASSRNNLTHFLNQYFLDFVVKDWSKIKILFDFNKEITSKKGRFKIGSEYLEAGTLKNLDKSLWSYIPQEYKEIKAIKKVKFEPTIDDKGLIKLTGNFVANDDLRLIMNSVHFEKNKGEVSTDTHKLLWIFNHTKYNGNYCLHKHCKKLEEKTGDKVKDLKYPEYDKVIPDVSTLNSIEIQVNSLRRFLKGISDILDFDLRELSIPLKLDNDTFLHLDNIFLKESIETMQKLGYNEIEFLFKDPTRAVIICPKGKSEKVNDFKTDFILIMPKMGFTLYDKHLYFDLETQKVCSYNVDFKEYDLSDDYFEKIKLRDEIKKEVTEQIKSELEKEQKQKAEQERTSYIEGILDKYNWNNTFEQGGQVNNFIEDVINKYGWGNEINEVEQLKKEIEQKKQTARYLAGNKKGAWGLPTQADEKRNNEIRLLEDKLKAIKSNTSVINDNKQPEKTAEKETEDIKILKTTEKGAMLITDGKKTAWIMPKQKRADGTFTKGAYKALAESNRNYINKNDVVDLKVCGIEKETAKATLFNVTLEYGINNNSNNQDKKLKLNSKAWLPKYAYTNKGNNVIAVSKLFYEKELKEVKNNIIYIFDKRGFIDKGDYYSIPVIVEEYASEQFLNRKLFVPKKVGKIINDDLIVPEWFISKKFEEIESSVRTGGFKHVGMNVGFSNDAWFKVYPTIINCQENVKSYEFGGNILDFRKGGQVKKTRKVKQYRKFGGVIHTLYKTNVRKTTVSKIRRKLISTKEADYVKSVKTKKGLYNVYYVKSK